MLRPMNSPSDTHNDHLRQLLDQRATRANHGRFPSLSEFSDSPSVYSHAYFSPRPLDKADIDANSDGFTFEIPSPHPTPASEPRTPMSDRERLNDPTASGLDLADDSRLSFASSDAYTADEHDENRSELDEADNESMLRMSMLGPKMRFHSLAPWETDEDPLEEEDESDNGNAKPISIFYRGRNNAARKGLGVGSTEHRASSASRPSGESSRKKSFETTASGSTGALQALAQASISSSSLVTPPPGQSSNRSKFSLGRARSRTPSNYHPSSPNSTHAPSPRSAHFHYHVSNSSPRDTISSSPRSNFSPSDVTAPSRPSTSSTRSEDGFIHPYANPDLVVSYAHEPTLQSSHAPSQSPHRLAFPQNVTRSDSTSTVTDSLTVSSTSRSASMSTLTPDTTTSSVSKNDREQNVPNCISSRQGKEISSPMPVSNLHSGEPSSTVNGKYREKKPSSLHPPLAGVSNLPGWQDNPASPTITLISLEEAQALARERSRTSTAYSAVSTGVNSSTASARIPFPEPDQGSSNGSQSDAPPGRSRARSTSAGARAKQALHSIVAGPMPVKPERRDSEPTAVPQPQYSQAGGPSSKLLKHKKSGFMRLFNGRERDKERDREPPPPMPPLSDAFIAYSSNASGQQRMPKIPRIPVPPLSPPSSLQDSSSQATFLSADFLSNPLDKRSLESRADEQNPKRALPPLSIVTQPQLQRSTPLNGPSLQAHPHPFPQSAPPGRTDFHALSLRPVSTLFSAHFSDHIVVNESGSQNESDLDISGSTSPGISPHTAGNSPLTPGFPNRDPAGDRHSVASSEDQTSVIQALQDQIVSARKAWQRQIWELEGQVRDLKTEVEELRTAGNDKDYCEMCGRGKSGQVNGDGISHETRKLGIVNRPRARTGNAARFGSAV